MTNKPGIVSREFAGDSDLLKMYALSDAAMEEALNVVDLPWRLTSPSARIPRRIRLWEEANGSLVAWAALQFPAWHCLDYTVLSEARTPELESDILTWACKSLEAEASARSSSLPFYVSAREQDTARIFAIEQAGFVRQDWGYVHLIRDLKEPIPEDPALSGLRVRSLRGDGEVERYVAAHREAFETTNMTPAWRHATLHDSRYVPELDLVAVTPDDMVAGFCVCWITPSPTGRQVAQVEPLGVIPEYQRHGVGRALLLEGLRRAKARGADRMVVNAESYNAASQGVYESVGFRPAYDTPFFMQSFGSKLTSQAES